MSKILKIKTQKEIKQESKKFKTKTKQEQFVIDKTSEYSFKKKSNQDLKAKRKLDDRLYERRGTYIIVFINKNNDEFYKNNDGKIYTYVGSTTNFEKRLQQHKKDLKQKYNIPENFELILCIMDSIPVKEQDLGTPYARRGWLLVKECELWDKVNRNVLFENLFYEHELRNLTPLNKCPWLLLSNVNFLGFGGKKK